MISLGPWLLFEFPPSTASRAENQQQPRSQGNHLSAPCGIIYYHRRGQSFEVGGGGANVKPVSTYPCQKNWKLIGFVHYFLEGPQIHILKNVILGRANANTENLKGPRSFLESLPK